MFTFKLCFIGLVYGTIYRKPPYLMVNTMVSGVDFPLNQSIECSNPSHVGLCQAFCESTQALVESPIVQVIGDVSRNPNSWMVDFRENPNLKWMITWKYKSFKSYTPLACKSSWDFKLDSIHVDFNIWGFPLAGDTQ